MTVIEMVVFGVYESGGEIHLETCPVTKNTKNQIVLKRRMKSYGYRMKLSKVYDFIAYTPEQAVKHFIKEKKQKLEQLSQETGRLREHIIQAEGLLAETYKGEI